MRRLMSTGRASAPGEETRADRWAKCSIERTLRPLDETLAQGLGASALLEDEIDPPRFPGAQVDFAFHGQVPHPASAHVFRAEQVVTRRD